MGMVILAGAILGALWGYFQAARRGGSGKDKAQFAAVWGLIGVILSAFLAVGLDRVI